jgi:predicted nucleic acid-binding protein
MKKNQFDTIYHEHYYYYSVTFLKKIFKYYDLKMYKIEKLSTHGGSLRVYVSHIKNNIKVHSSVKNIHKEEIDYGIAKIKTYKDFEVKINNIKKKFNKFIINANKNKKNIFAYGAPAKGNTFLNFCNIKKTDVIGTFDKSPLKINKFLPGTHIKIFSPNMMKKFKIDILIILPWNIKKEVIDMVKKNSTSKKIKFVTAIPSLKIFN